MKLPSHSTQVRGINLRLLVAIPLVFAITQIVSTLADARKNDYSAYKVLARQFPKQQMTVLPPVTPDSQLLAFLGPEWLYAVCPFDARKSPVRIRADLPNLGWSLAIMRTDGSTAYFSTAASGRTTKVATTIIDNADRFMGVTPQAMGKVSLGSPDELVEAKRGLVVVRAPNRGPVYQNETQGELATATCREVKEARITDAAQDSATSEEVEENAQN